MQKSTIETRARLAFIKQIEQLEVRRGMYVGHEYESLISFIDGYAMALKDMFGIDLLKGFQGFLHSKAGHQFAQRWGHYLKVISGNSGEEKATFFVFSYWKEYLTGTKEGGEE